MGRNEPTITRADEGRQDQLSLVLVERESQPKAPRPANRSPLARSSDPVSSHLTAEEVTRSGRRDNQKHKLIEWLRRQTQPMTLAEIAVSSGMERHAVARRLPDCERGGPVERCGMRECGAAGRPAITWRATR
jgi:hypothetical protein